jgi:hypothetical protein
MTSTYLVAEGISGAGRDAERSGVVEVEVCGRSWVVGTYELHPLAAAAATRQPSSRLIDQMNDGGTRPRNPLRLAAEELPRLCKG